MATKKPVTTTRLKKMKADQEKITMLTAYDYPSAKLADEAGIDILLVGDSLGMVVLGYDSTLPVKVDDIIHHTKAVARGTKRALVVADMPFLSYHGSWDQTLHNAGRMIQEGNATAVKIEGGREVKETVTKLVHTGIPVMGHLGLTPQMVNQLGGYRVQGKEPEAAKKIIEDARILEEAGCFALVLECIPAGLAKIISQSVSIPTIGIGAGPDCDGQVLVFHDMLGYGGDRYPKFVKNYGSIGSNIKSAITAYIEDVENGNFPQPEHTYTIDESFLDNLYGEGDKE